MSYKELLEVLEWADRQLKILVTDDDGTGTFIRGTGTELAGFCIGREKLTAAIKHVRAEL